jgi:5-methylcytosine-specific restriction endonuclease McrA
MADDRTIKQVWAKGKTIAGEDQATWRKDEEGNRIRFSSYGTQGTYGWEIDHKTAVARGGTDNLSNLQPLHWQANREKSDKPR